MSASEPLSDAPVVAVGSVKSAYRTVQVLELLASRPQRLTLSELQRELGVPKSSLHSLLQTLVERGWLETTSSGAAYGIGLRALRVGTAYLERDPIVEAAGPLLAQLRSHLDETVHLARLDGADIVYLASRESAHHLRSSSRIGRRLPAHSTALGKVLLAARSDTEVRELLPPRLVALTPHTVTSITDLEAELAEIRVQGHSFEHGQNTPGLACVAVAILGRGQPVDAISCSVPAVRLTDEHRKQIIAALTQSADELGYVARRGD
jgi:DNA-binding IclR family transcriptional regulator